MGKSTELLIGLTVLKDYENYTRWNPMTLDALNEDRKPNIQGTMPFQKVSMFHEKNPLMKESGEYIRTDANGKETTVTFYVIPTDGKSLKKSKKVQI